MQNTMDELRAIIETTKGQLALALAILLSLGFDPSDLSDLL
jgi:hypothetical protein